MSDVRFVPTARSTRWITSIDTVGEWYAIERFALS